MPFTFAHPAAILPLRRFKPLQTVPLIVGSVTPDLPHYIPQRLNRLNLETHTALGALTLDIPIGLFVLVIGFLLRRPLTALMTPRARALCLETMERFRHQPMHWVWAVLAIYVGTWTHLAWDSFTHDNGWLVRRVAALSAPVTIGDYTGSMCHVLQYVSSIAGLVILAIWYFRLPTPTAESLATATPQEPLPARAALLTLVIATAAAIGIYIAVQADLAGSAYYRVIYLLLTRGIAWFAFLYTVVGLLVTFGRRKPEALAEI